MRQHNVGDIVVCNAVVANKLVTVSKTRGRVVSVDVVDKSTIVWVLEDESKMRVGRHPNGLSAA